MRRLFTNFSMLLLLTISISSCKKSSNSTNNNNIPGNCVNNTGWVRDGHSWVYTNEPIYIFADSLFVTMESAGSGIFKSTSTFDNGTPFSGYAKPCGNYIYQAADAAMTNAQIAYYVDGNINDTWSSVVTSTGGYTVTNTFTITDKNVSITVPAGTFSCLVIHITSHSTQPGSLTVETDLYMNNTYGMIETDGNTSHYELVRKNF
ncbi:MAG: hypothetical protein JWN78_1074 [Bacteroidota bacterium]|nr:hypothetical protein [Bacteroidota bacterium]